MEPLLRMFWYIAIPVSVIFVIQTVMTFFGGDASEMGDADIDVDGGDATPFQLFSFRNLINFLLGFGWAGLSLYSSITNPTLLIFAALIIGCLFVYMFFLIISQLMKLAEDGSFRMESTINKNAEVYLTIPANKSAKGKVLISIKGSVRELDAITDGEAIPTSSLVKVIRVENEKILVVEKI
jgi:hypothetical protein